MKKFRHITRITSLFIASTFMLIVLTGTAKSDEKIKVVATFSILGDMVKRIGGDHILLTTLVGPNGDTHVYKPSPAAAKALSQADVLFVNGLDFEGWITRLIEASGFKGRHVVTTSGVKTIAYEEGEGHDDHSDDPHDKHAKKKHADDKHHDDHSDDPHDKHAKKKHADDKHHDDHSDDPHDKHAKKKHADDKHHDDHSDDPHDKHAKKKHAGDKHHDDHAHHDHGEFDPHAWQSLINARVYVDNITDALAQFAPDKAAKFYQNRATYTAEIESMHNQIKKLISSLPQHQRTVVTSHDAFQYFGRDYGITFLAPQGLSTDSEASAQDVAKLIEQMRTKKIKAVFLENITDPRLLQQIAKETGAKIGGTLYPGALSEPDGPAPTYLKMLHHNAKTLSQALGS